MSIDATLLTLFEELVTDWDETVDTSPGSPFYASVIEPLLTRIGGSPLDANLEDFFVERLQTEIEGIDLSPFSGMRDLAVRAAAVVQEPLRREIAAVRVRQSLNNYPQMTRAELDEHLGNFFTSLEPGQFSTGTGRVYFPSPQSITVTPLTQFSTGGGLNFFPTNAQQISATQMSFNQEGDLFFFDVQLTAEAAGTDYDIEPGSLSTVTGLTGVTRVTNLSRFRSGLQEETKAEGVARAQNSITIRNLITDRGAKYVLPEAFSDIDTLQVIGFGDPEMLRDVVAGPADISGVPGGIAGLDDPALGMGEVIHIGGKTDIYVYQRSIDSGFLDIENLTDKGVQRYAGSFGFTAAGAATDTFQDEYGLFATRGITSGDLLYLDDTVYTILSVTETTLQVTTSTIPAALFNKTYEIIRPVAGFITVPLYDLVATDDDGAALFDTDGDPIEPIPGSRPNNQLLSGGVPVKKTENISSANVALPLLRASTVEFLDPLTLAGTGTFIPMRDILAVRAVDDFATSGSYGGTVRIFFRDAVNAWVTRSLTRFTYQSFTFRPVAEEQGSTQGTGVSFASGTSGGTEIVLSNGNFTEANGFFSVGYRVEILAGAAAGTYTVVGGSYDGGANETTLTIREELPATFSNEDWLWHVGVGEANIPQDAATGLYYLDLDVEVILGTPAILEDTTFGYDAVTSEGWSLKTTNSVLSYSTKELPYLQVTPWVNDTTEILVDFTAPAVRVTYEYASTLADVQTFADDPANRIVSEDVLIKHFVPSYVRAQFSVRDLTADLSDETVENYINDLDPTSDLEVSDLSDALYAAGATKVFMPVTLVGMTQNRDRSWTATFSQDALTSSRIQHFLADSDFITATEL